MSEQLTIPADPNQAVVGYIINSGLSEGLCNSITKVQGRLEERFPGVIWSAPQYSLHLTLMDWLAPLVDYGQDKDELFHSIEDEYATTLADILMGQGPIQVTFDAIEVYPAAIIVKGRDDGTYQRIREKFLERVELLPGTKPPPKIIHTTICKFLGQLDAEEVADFVRNESLHAHEEISEFRLARETQIFMLKHEILRRFNLR